MSTTTNFLDLCDAIKNYYGTGSDQWTEIAKYGMNADNFTEIVRQVPGVNVTTAQNGRVLGYSVDVTEPFTTNLPSVAQQINSNATAGQGIASTSANLHIPASTAVDQSTGAAGALSGVTRQYSGGSVVQTAGKFVTGEVLPAVMAASAAIQLAKIVDTGLYYGLPLIFDDIDVTYLNPETWNSITTDYDGPGALKAAFNMIFRLDPETGNMQAYADEKALAYYAMYLKEKGFFDAGGEPHTGEIVTTGFRFPQMANNQPINVIPHPTGIPLPRSSGGVIRTVTSLTCDSTVYGISLRANSNPVFALISQSPCSYTMKDTNPSTGSENTFSGSSSRYTNNSGETFYFGGATALSNSFTDYKQLSFNPSPDLFQYPIWGDVWHIIITSGIVTPSSPVPGVSDLPGGTQPITNNWTTINNTITSLQEQYPDLWDNRLENDVIQPDGTTETITFVPVPFPDGFNDTDPDNPDAPAQPTSSGESSNQIDPYIAPEYPGYPEFDTDTLIQTIIEIIIQNDPSGMVDPENAPSADQDNPLNPDPNPPNGGGGDTPAVVTPTGSASALWTVYNPSQAQVDAFGAWLWSSNFIDQVKKLFADPMQGIIGIHKIYATPAVSGSGTIVCGYLDSNVSSNIVGSQYTTVDCGSVFLPEYFGNVLDYENTELYIYLPFIGIQQLDIGQCMRGVISVKYTVDVYTGACLAEISVARDNAGGVLYTFSGDCAVRYPISSGSYMGIVSGILTTVGAVAGGIVTGNPLLAGMGAISGLGNARANVQQSGSISGNAGAMGIKKPYLIVTRPQTVYTDFPRLQGYGANTAVSVTSVSGYARFDDVRVDVPDATEEEKAEIKRLCESGIYV